MLSSVVLNTAMAPVLLLLIVQLARAAPAFPLWHVVFRSLNGKVWVHTSEPRATNVSWGVQQVLMLCT